MFVHEFGNSLCGTVSHHMIDLTEGQLSLLKTMKELAGFAHTLPRLALQANAEPSQQSSPGLRQIHAASSTFLGTLIQPAHLSNGHGDACDGTAPHTLNIVEQTGVAEDVARHNSHGRIGALGQAQGADRGV